MLLGCAGRMVMASLGTTTRHIYSAATKRACVAVGRGVNKCEAAGTSSNSNKARCMHNTALMDETENVQVQHEDHFK
jgi:hypothetical protein